MKRGAGGGRGVGRTVAMDVEFERSTGPKRYSYKELTRATDRFDEKNKLGEGGFGGVYKGMLKGTIVAIKRVSKGSSQGVKDFRDGAYERDELLLVYEFMPNGSLDTHLFKSEVALTWSDKSIEISSRVTIMLDSSFNAKLGDFGLAKLVEHLKESGNTVIAGTQGYIDPESVMTGTENEVSLVDWVYDLNQDGKLLDAVDPKLNNAYNETELQCLLVVGLWCAQPTQVSRPSIRKASLVLNFEAPLPTLPDRVPNSLSYFNRPLAGNDDEESFTRLSLVEAHPSPSLHLHLSAHLPSSMVARISSSAHIQPPPTNLHVITILSLLTLTFRSTSALTLNLTTFTGAIDNFRFGDGTEYYNNATIEADSLVLTKMVNWTTGRVTYNEPVHLWDNASNSLADFSTHFSFVIESFGVEPYSDGLAFFLAPDGVSGAGSAGGEWTGDGERGEMKSGVLDGKLSEAWINYDAVSKELSVVFTGFDNNVTVLQSLNYTIDLRKILPEIVCLGFEPPPGRILSFTVYDRGGSIRSLSHSMRPLDLLFGGNEGRDKELRLGMDEEFENGTGPKRTTVAIKRVSKGSRQGVKEYASEVRVISKLRHRNLVQLLGWCHERDEMLLVYEFMPNGSLDTHLFKSEIALTWASRFKIAQGLASALLYLHEGCDQYVVHRDIKSSNVMLDSAFNRQAWGLWLSTTWLIIKKSPKQLSLPGHEATLTPKAS
ncbi:unnamed protein product [Rhodiola kirilowii]